MDTSTKILYGGIIIIGLIAVSLAAIFVRPILAVQMKHDCDTSNMAGVMGSAIERWCEAELDK